MTFRLTITAADSADQIAQNLRAVALALSNRFDGLTPPATDPQPIRDTSGRIVGQWSITAPNESEQV